MTLHRFLLPLALLVIGSVLVPAAPVAQEAAPTLSPSEQRIVEYVRSDAEAAIELLERTVNINSGTLNPAGVRRVAEVMAPEFEALGFTVRLADLSEVNRGPHLIAERQGSQGLRLLLIGHLDTVFEEDDEFQQWERLDENTARGPGANDMKGGNIVILHALRALHAAGDLDNTTITVVLTGDEESPGRPLSVSRRDLIAAAEQSDVALGFEAGSRDAEGDLGVVARRSSSSWRLTVSGRAAHSSGIFSEDTGSGAVYEAARILHRFHEELRDEPGATFNAATIAGGTEAEWNAAEGRGSAFGKTNVVAGTAIVSGDIRTLSDESLKSIRERMRAIVAENLPHTSAEITFTDGYPSMAPREENYRLLALLDEISRSLDYSGIRPFDPAGRGAADISFVAPLIPGLDALGPLGSGGHTGRETVNIPSVQVATERAALLIYRLTREGAEREVERGA